MAAYIVKVMIEHTHPPVWRRIAVPEKIYYKDLHAILQAAFGWDDDHLHDFTFPDSDFRVVMSEDDMSFGRCALEGSRLIDEDITGVNWIRYTYDFGDNWAHKITFEKMDPDYPHRYATILKWKGDNFCEDVGGVFGAEYFMTDEAKEEYGEDYMDPRQAFDLQQTNDLLARRSFPERKSKGKAASGEGSPGSANPAFEKQMKQFMRELMKQIKESNTFGLTGMQDTKPEKPSKIDAMAKKWLDFSDRWANALQSAGISSTPAKDGKQAFKEIQEQLPKEEGKWEQMVLPGIELPEEKAEQNLGERHGNDITVGNCTLRITTGEHTVEQNLQNNSDKALRDYCKYLRLDTEPSRKADRAAAIAKTFHEHPEYLRMPSTKEQLECLLSMAGLRDSRYQIMSTDAVEMAIHLGLMECIISHKKYMWQAELCFACDAKDILSRADGTDLDDYYSKLDEKDQNVLSILFAYGFIKFEELRKIAKKYAGIRDTATDFERYLYWHLRLQDKIVTLTWGPVSETAPYAALSGIDAKRVSDTLIHFEDSLTLKPFSNERFKAWQENSLFSIDAWKKLLMLAMGCLNIDGNSPEEIPFEFIEYCYHMVLSGYDVRELCTEFCKEVPLQYVSQYAFLWHFAYEVVTETPIPALMGHSRNEFIEMFADEESPEMDAFYEYIPIFPYEGIEGKMKADTHLYELAEAVAEDLMLALSYAQISGDQSLLNNFIRDHGHSDELLFLKAVMEADSGDSKKAKKTIEGLIKSHKGPVDDLIEFRDSALSSGATKGKRKKASKTETAEAIELFNEYFRLKMSHEADFDPDYESYYEPDHVVQIPVQRESPKIYPNDPCPCGSGKKYKKCCGKNKT